MMIKLWIVIMFALQLKGKVAMFALQLKSEDVK